MALDEAIACDLEAGGNIDPNLFQELSKMSYLIYKVDGNAIGRGGSCSVSKPGLRSYLSEY